MILTIRREGDEPRSVTVAGSEAFLGKHADCQVVLADPKVSRRHARIIEHEGRLFVEDLDSTNGTRAAGRAVQSQTALDDGAEVEIGPYRIAVRRNAAGGAEAPPTETVTVPVAAPAGLGVLDSLLADDSISEIMVNGPAEVFVERRGALEETTVRFASAERLRDLIVKIAADVGRVIDERQPLLDARLRDGSRVNAVLTPLAVRGPYLTIRRFPNRRLVAEQLVENGTLSAPMLALLRAAVVGRISMLVAGGTGTGKTTLLAALCGFISPRERIVSIEDAAELRLPLPHVLPMEARPPDAAGEGAVTIRDLVRNALRMRPDRIVVGEVRGAEALDMLQAMNTGHEGSLTTIHANSPREALQRLETLVLFAGTELPQRAVREQIVGAIDLIVQVSRGRDGRRRVTAIEELTGLESEQFTTGEIFRYDEKQAVFQPTGYIPKLRERLIRADVPFDNAWFRA
ncbi:MAG TPA: ATPase, T2SS/T4P/T4SS family [Candidatus Binatia bacterium]|nr:ATPase, T2SS/T4P/T4SS family [Candidatus Binatia bacterium]